MTIRDALAAIGLVCVAASLSAALILLALSFGRPMFPDEDEG